VKEGQYTIIIASEVARKKLDSLGRHKGEYISKLIEEAIWKENIEARIKELEGKK